MSKMQSITTKLTTPRTSIVPRTKPIWALNFCVLILNVLVSSAAVKYHGNSS